MSQTLRNATALLGLAAMCALVAPATVAAAARVGAPAPAFTLSDSNGGAHSLSDYAGKYVVLEWVNFDCPFVKKHYGSGNMQALQKDYTGRGVVWLAVNSSAVGNQGHFANDDHWCTPEAVDRLEAALGTVAIPWEVHRYDAAHAFFNETVEAYDDGACQRSWARTLDFLAQHL